MAQLANSSGNAYFCEFNSGMPNSGGDKNSGRPHKNMSRSLFRQDFTRNIITLFGGGGRGKVHAEIPPC